MNYLAHAYLSFGEPEILVGNMISDFVKGKQKFEYAAGVQKGIELHRTIDDFTDHHAATHRAKEFFKKDYRLYAGAFIDVVFDHFLANDKNEFSNEDALKSFTSKTYASLQNYVDIFPVRFVKFFHYMQQEDWLYHYRFNQGIFSSFGGLVRRAKYLDDSATAAKLFIEHYDELQLCYDDFFNDVKKFAFHHFSELIKN